MHKGFAGTLVALSLIFSLHAFWNTSITTSSTILDAEQKALFLEKAYYDEVSFKDSLRSTLRHAKGSDRNAILENAKVKLKQWSKNAKAFLEKDKAKAVVWSGFATTAELESLSDEMLKKQKPLYCNCCFKQTENLDVLDYDATLNAITISKNKAVAQKPKCRNGASPDPTLAAFIGASVFYENQKAAFVFLVPEGFGVEIESTTLP
ncbi:MAG: hypothetical protein ACE5DI_04440 [Candidatus Micrarchaeia archaeon]